MFSFDESAVSVLSLQVRNASTADSETNDGSPRVVQMLTVRASIVVPFDVWGAGVLVSDGMAQALMKMANAQDSAESAGGNVEARFALKGTLCPGETVMTFRRHYEDGLGVTQFAETRVVVDYVGAPSVGVRDVSTATIKATFEAMVEAPGLCELAALVKNERVTVEAVFTPAQAELFSPQNSAQRVPEPPVFDDECCPDNGEGDAANGDLEALAGLPDDLRRIVLDLPPEYQA